MSNPITKEQLKEVLNNFESEQVERTISIKDFDKFAQAICAFSNDLSNTGKKGYLLIGVNDDGTLSEFKANDQLLQSLGGLRSDGNILPQPIMSVSSFSLTEGDVVVIEVRPSPFPPVRYKGRTWIRVGARKAIASEMEERLLIEKRTANVSTFDIRPSVGNGLNIIETDIFQNSYLPSAIDKDILSDDHRTIEEQLASLRFYSPNYNLVTNAAILLFGKSVEHHLPGAYIQYVRFNGLTNADEPINEKKFSDNLFKLLPELDKFIEYAIIKQKPVPVSVLKEKTQYNFPRWSIRELLMNAIMHRDYESNAPIKFYQYNDRIEIVNTGGLYGNARPENFPNVNDYRNPVVAEAMKVLNYVNRFNRGVARVKRELIENGNPKPIFDYANLGIFGVTIFDATYSTVEESVKESVKEIIKTNPKVTISELQGITGLTKRQVDYQMNKLKEEGLLKRVGSTKSGHWEI
jgi:ATP-dependent DNA helicase RecG